MTNFLIVDNTKFVTDASNWSTHGIGTEYNSSTMLAQKTGSSWAYTFAGSYVEVVGTLKANSPATLTYAINGSQPKTYTSSNFTSPSWKFHQTLFSIEDLEPDQVYTLEVAQTDSGEVFFDYLLYEASEFANLTSQDRIFIDDRDTNKLRYRTTQNVELYPDPGKDDTEHFKNSITKVKSVDNSVSLTFTGSKVEVYGCRDWVNTSQSLFSLDDQAPSPNFPGTGTADQGGNGLWNVLLWQSPVVEGNQQHTLNMTLTSGDNGLCLDYLLVTPPEGRSLASNPSRSSSSKSSRNLPAYGIALITIGAIMTLGLLVGAFLLHRRRQQKNVRGSHIPVLQEVEINPFTLEGAIVTQSVATRTSPYSDTKNWSRSIFHLQRGRSVSSNISPPAYSESGPSIQGTGERITGRKR